jgi:hypothetical protein
MLRLAVIRGLLVVHFLGKNPSTFVYNLNRCCATLAFFLQPPVAT